MAKRRNRYKEMEQKVTYVLLVGLALFLLFLLFSYLDVTFLKVTLAVLTIVLSCLTLGFLFITHELMRKRSRWMSVGALSLLLCTVVSLVANYPGV